MTIVASLTSTPARVRKSVQTLRSLLAQTCPLDAVYLWLPRRSARSGAAIGPDDLEDLAPLRREDARLHVTLLDHDFGPATKLLPVLAAHTEPATRIFYCDDDVVYGPDMVGWLAECAQFWPDAAVGVSLFDLDARQARTTESGANYHAYRLISAHGQTGSIIEGYGGVLVQRRFFGAGFATLLPALDHSANFAAEAGAMPSLSDDLIISCYLRARGIRLMNVQVPGCNRQSLTLLEHGFGADSLHSLHADGGPFGNLVRYTRLLPRVTAAVAHAVDAEKPRLS